MTFPVTFSAPSWFFPVRRSVGSFAYRDREGLRSPFSVPPIGVLRLPFTTKKELETAAANLTLAAPPRRKRVGCVNLLYTLCGSFSAIGTDRVSRDRWNSITDKK